MDIAGSFCFSRGLLGLALLTVLVGCGTTAGGSAAPTPCVDGVCADPLTCVDGQCVWTPPADGGVQDAGSVGDAADTAGPQGFGACIEQHCASQIAACTGLCATWWACQVTCDATDTACAADCAGKMSGDVTASGQANSVIQCQVTNASKCQWAPDGPDVSVPDAGVTGDTGGPVPKDTVGGGCKKDEDCGKGSCILTQETCVECVSTMQCDPGEICLSNACATAVKCESDKQCASLDAVCGYGLCVDCKSDNDCTGNTSCKVQPIKSEDFVVVGHCVPDPPSCKSSKECAVYDKVCVNYDCVDCKSAVDCPPLNNCISNTCIPKPKICEPGTSECSGTYAVKECIEQGTKTKKTYCEGDTECSKQGNSASCGPSCCSKKGAECGYFTDCGKSCGSCKKGDTCIDHKCVPPPPKLKLGDACNASPQCPLPKPSDGQSKINQFFGCLDDLCAGELCFRSEFCTSMTCKPKKDSDGDGVEDVDANSDCTGAGSSSIAGTKFRCVRQAYNANSYPNLCLPGTTFKSCTTDADCPGGEACTILTILGTGQKRCMGKVKNIDGYSAATGVAYCDAINQFGNGPKFCANSLCISGIGCLQFCKQDSECAKATLQSVCDSGHCGGQQAGSSCTGNSCTGKWTCKQSSVYGVSAKICLQ